MVVSDDYNTLNNTSNSGYNNNNHKFSRELSEFVNNNLHILDTPAKQKLDSENTIDLSAIIIQDQSAYRKTMPLSDILASNTTIYGNASSSSIASGSSAVKALAYLQSSDKNEDESTMNTDYEESENTLDYEEPTTTSNKRKAGNISGRNKRLSTTSTSSSTAELAATGKGRGRGGRRSARVDSLLSNQDTNDDGLARFGNKYVTKGTEEYNERRNKNNDAVKKCRAKLQEKQKEREQRLKQLSEENRKLTNTVDSLNKELNVLKGILATMKPQYTIPVDIEEKIKKLESMVMANNNQQHKQNT